MSSSTNRRVGPVRGAASASEEAGAVSPVGEAGLAPPPAWVLLLSGALGAPILVQRPGEEGDEEAEEEWDEEEDEFDEDEEDDEDEDEDEEDEEDDEDEDWEEDEEEEE